MFVVHGFSKGPGFAGCCCNRSEMLFRMATRNFVSLMV